MRTTFFSLLFAGFLISGSLSYADKHTHDIAMQHPYDEAAINRLLADGEPVFIEFSADWCSTCQINKRTTLSDPKLMKAFRDKGIHKFFGDWTKREKNRRVTKAILKYRRKAGVPVYVIYPKGNETNPVVLSGRISVRDVLSNLE